MKFSVTFNHFDSRVVKSCAKDPEFHIWACNEQSKSDFVNIAIGDEFSLSKDLEVKGKEKTMICVDLYGYELNNRGQHCKVHLGSGTCAVSTTEQIIQIVNKNSGVEYGS